MIITNDENGEWIENDLFCLFFGNKNSQLFTANNNIQFGHQVHKADLLEVDKLPDGSSCFIDDSDGLWTKMPKLELGLYTADCVPCFIHQNNTLYSLHLGWRSLHLGLLDKALQKVSKSEYLYIYIGPHIQFDSFEVGEEVFKSFERQLSPYKSTEWFRVLSNNKFKLSLSKIIELKTRSYNSQIYSSKIDTYITKSYCSYRKQHQTKERNISFAFLK